MYDRALDDLETGVVPRLGDPVVKLRARSAATLLRHFRAVDAIGSAVADAEREDLERLLGPGEHDPDGEALGRLADTAGTGGDHDVLAYLAAPGRGAPSRCGPTGERAQARAGFTRLAVATE